MDKIQLKIYWKDAPYIVSDLSEYSDGQLMDFFQLIERHDKDSVELTIDKNETNREIKTFNDFNKDDDIKFDTSGFMIAGDNYYIWASFFNDKIEGFVKIKDPIDPTRVIAIQDPCELNDDDTKELSSILDAIDSPSNSEDVENEKVYVGLYELIEV